MSAIMYGTGNAHFDQWVDSLATTTLPQGQSRLVTISWETGQPEGYCCLGVACRLVPGLSITVNEDHDEDGNPWSGTETRYDEVGYYGPWSEMAPPELLDWLGITDHENTEADIQIDLPPEYAMTQGIKLYRTINGEEVAESGGSANEPALGASTLNDRYQLTFKQIADVLRYFGVKDSVQE